ncbi:MAG: cytochrome o ubiquinol oxidase subunit III [Candidatus Tokpelaia sp. JSC189]|nr:MAG: cytochrome o ubiquinol oxidase subunit III [Candidatus Tokpelaia sp. JSC189]
MTVTAVETTHVAQHHCGDASIKIFGFWIYILQDLFLFATLFANFAVFSSAYDGGSVGKDFINLPFVIFETFFLLVSSISYGFSIVKMYSNNLKATRFWLQITFVLGAIFVGMELYEFMHLIHEGATPSVSAYWSAFFVLVATHGIHVTGGLIWMACMFVHLSCHGLNADNRVRLICLSLFWHFLDIVWIGVFTVVYLLGAL